MDIETMDNLTLVFEPEEHESNFSIITMSFFLLVSLATLVNNGFLVCVVAMVADIRKAWTMFLVNLSAAHILFSVCAPFFVTSMILGYWPFGEATCKLHIMLIGVGLLMASWTLVMLSIMMALTAFSPATSKRIQTPLVVGISVTVVWVCAILAMLPVGIFSTVMQVSPSNSFCVKSWQGHYLYEFLVIFALPVSLIIILSVLTLVKTYGGTARNHGPYSERGISNHEQQQITLCLVIAFVICNLPYWCLQVLFIAHRHLYTAFDLLARVNYVLNPILYPLVSISVRRAYYRVIGRGGSPVQSAPVDLPLETCTA